MPFVRCWESPLPQFTHGGASLSVSLSPSSLAPDAPSRSPVALLRPLSQLAVLLHSSVP